MHRDLFAESRDFLNITSRFHTNQQADLTKIRGYRIVHIAGHDTLRHRELASSAQIHVLANFCNRIGNGRFNGFAAGS